MSGFVSVYATFGSDEEARRVSRQLVEERLAACANVLGPCHSIYRWEGKIEEASEVAAIFKTTTDQATHLIDRLTTLHSYDVPAAVAWEATQANATYAKWVESQVSGDSTKGW